MKENNSGLIFSILYSVFAFTLFLAFMVLKLCGVIDWNWWLVTLPLWAIPAAFTGLYLVLLVIYGVYLFVRKMRIRAIQRRINNGK